MTTAILYPDLSLGQELQLVQGSDADFVIQAANTDGTFPVFASGDTIKTVLYQGQSMTALFDPATIWTGGTGYLTGNLTSSPTNVQTATLDANGEYTLQAWWESADTTRKACIARRRIKVLGAPGTGVNTITPYNTYQDMLNYGAWVDGVQDMDADQEGFYQQRLDARTWFDWSVINSYTNNYLGLYGRHSEMAFAFAGGYGMRQSTGPNPTIIGYLASNLLIVRPQVVEACAHFALGRVGLTQVGLNPSFVQYGYYHQKRAERLATAITAEINTLQGLPGDTGVGSIFVNLGSSNTLLG